MAHVLGAITSSHVPAIGRAIAKNLQADPYWKPFFDGFTPVHRWLKQAKPDVVVVFYNDHGLNFFLDKLPTFAIARPMAGTCELVTAPTMVAMAIPPLWPAWP